MKFLIQKFLGIIKSAAGLYFFIFAGVERVYAQVVTCPTGYQLNSAGVCLPNSGGSGPGSISTLPQLITQVIEYALYFSGVVAVLTIIYGGYLYITAAGNTEQAEKGRTALTNSIIGLVVIGFAFVIVRVVANSIINGPTV